MTEAEIAALFADEQGRSHFCAPLRELKLAGNSESEMVFSGYGAVFNNVDAYGDVIVPGAFADTLAEIKRSGVWPVMQSQHGAMGLTAKDMEPLGIWTELSEDGVGLKVAGKLCDTPNGIAMHKLMKMQPRSAIDGLSIGYIAKESTPRSKPEDPRRTLRKIDLVEISLVTYPANRLARVTDVKAVIEKIESLSDAEHLLRDAGLSRAISVGLVSRIKALVVQSDSERKGVDDLRASIERAGNILKL